MSSVLPFHVARECLMRRWPFTTYSFWLSSPSSANRASRGGSGVSRLTLRLDGVWVMAASVPSQNCS